VSNIYFALTEAFNATERVVALASGQAVVFTAIAGRQMFEEGFLEAP